MVMIDVTGVDPESAIGGGVGHISLLRPERGPVEKDSSPRRGS
jgi:hypothetical protein